MKEQPSAPYNGVSAGKCTIDVAGSARPALAREEPWIAPEKKGSHIEVVGVKKVLRHLG